MFAAAGADACFGARLVEMLSKALRNVSAELHAPIVAGGTEGRVRGTIEQLAPRLMETGLVTLGDIEFFPRIAGDASSPTRCRSWSPRGASGRPRRIGRDNGVGGASRLLALACFQSSFFTLSRRAVLRSVGRPGLFNKLRACKVSLSNWTRLPGIMCSCWTANNVKNEMAQTAVKRAGGSGISLQCVRIGESL